MKQPIHFVLMFILLVIAISAKAQCAMCTATVENNIEDGGTAAKGLNDGILYMLIMPVIFVTIFILIYKKRKKYLAKFGEE